MDFRRAAAKQKLKSEMCGRNLFLTQLSSPARDTQTLRTYTPLLVFFLAGRVANLKRGPLAPSEETR
jgi:hypothetical protein